MGSTNLTQLKHLEVWLRASRLIEENKTSAKAPVIKDKRHVELYIVLYSDCSKAFNNSCVEGSDRDISELHNYRQQQFMEFQQIFQLLTPVIPQIIQNEQKQIDFCNHSANQYLS